MALGVTVVCLQGRCHSEIPGKADHSTHHIPHSCAVFFGHCTRWTGKDQTSAEPGGDSTNRTRLCLSVCVWRIDVEATTLLRVHHGRCWVVIQFRKRKTELTSVWKVRAWLWLQDSVCLGGTHKPWGLILHRQAWNTHNTRMLPRAEELV